MRPTWRNIWGIVSVALTLECFLIVGLRDAIEHEGVWRWVNVAIWVWISISIATMVWRGRGPAGRD